MAPWSRGGRGATGVAKRGAGGRPLNEAVYRRPPRGLGFFGTGVLALILIVIGCWFAYTKELPWAGEGYSVTATFDNATTLRETAPVRIAGVNVGEVTSVQPAGEGAKVTFTVDDEGRPLHEDATVKIRPRLFLEGNFFLDLRPGSPSAPELPDGGEIPVTRTATAVQLDEVLTALQRPDRENLARLLKGYGGALSDAPTAAQDRGMDPDVRGRSGAEAINETFRYGGRAGKGTAQVNEALLGERVGDLRGLIRSGGDVFGELAERESDLRGLINNLSITTGAFAAESANLERSLTELAPTVEQADGQLAEVNAGFPALRAYSRALIPGVEELPATIAAGTPWLRQADQLMRKRELGGVVRDLHAATPRLARGTSELGGMLRQLRLSSRCVTDVLDPTGDIVINDDFATGQPNFNEFLYGLAAQAGEGANFDGNGQFLRVQPGGGPVEAQTPIPGGNATLQDNINFGNTIAPPLGTQPLKPAKAPPTRTDVACHTNPVPNLNGPQAAVGPPNPEPSP